MGLQALSCFLSLPLSFSFCLEWSPDLVDLAIKYKGKGVVGVDVGGDELVPMDLHIPCFKVRNIRCQSL